MTTVVLALGSNLGRRLENLQAAIDRLAAAGVEVTATSGVWETPPVPADQPPFLNAVIAGATDLAPHALLGVAKQIEWDLGRRPARRWGPRPIDVDILFYGDRSIETESLTIPHPRIAERAFVLAPLAEIAEGPLPVLGSSASSLLDELDLAAMSRLPQALQLP